MAREIGEYLDELIKDRGEPETLKDAWALVSDANRNLMWDRHKKYGPNNIRKFGLYGIVIRATDKLERLTTMVFGEKDNKPDTTNESVEDTLGDLSNYGTIGILVNRGWWELPYVEDQEEPEPQVTLEAEVPENPYLPEGYKEAVEAEKPEKPYPQDSFAAIKAANGFYSQKEENKARIEAVVNSLAGTGPTVDRRTREYMKDTGRGYQSKDAVPLSTPGVYHKMGAVNQKLSGNAAPLRDPVTSVTVEYNKKNSSASKDTDESMVELNPPINRESSLEAVEQYQAAIRNHKDTNLSD